MNDYGYRSQNAKAYDRLVRSGSNFARTATDEECAAPLKTLDSRGWLPDSVSGWNVLCLGAGGGWQSILYAAAEANVTVVDISREMLMLDEREAKARGYSIQTVHGSMDDLSMLSANQFDLVHQPVSTCYVPDINAVYQEIARVTKPDGIYISQHKQPTGLQITHRNKQNLYVLGLEYYRTGPLPPVEDTSYREPNAQEYLHRWEDLVGGLCRSGFVLEDLTEPYRADPSAPIGHFKYRGRFTAPYVRLNARRVNTGPVSGTSRLWTPGAED